MRWHIAETKRKIASETFEGHGDRIEMSGERVSGVIGYAVHGGVPVYTRQFAYPMVRLQPNNTHASYQPECGTEPVVWPAAERFERVEFDGVLSVFSRAGDLRIIRRFFPSVRLPVFYEQVEVYNGGADEAVPQWEQNKRFDIRIACEGYVYAECVSSTPCRPIRPGERLTLVFAYGARYANETFPSEKHPLAARRARVRELISEVDLTTGDAVVDTMFAFAKLRAGESLFRTGKGLIHSPGGLHYYAAVWCNDECEYIAPWFAFTGDRKEREAAVNAFRWYEPFMNDEYRCIPLSIISCGRDYFTLGDRGDAAMYLYGLCRFLLTRGELPDDGQKRALAWCAEYIRRQINADGVVVSDTDELENRLSSGINLNTSSLSFGAYGLYAVLLKRMGDRAAAEKILALRAVIRAGIESYFGGEVAGYRTYHYHKGCNEIRAWNCLPVYMGITDRAKDTADSIADKLWTQGSCRSTEGEKILWDRSALYYLASLFRMGDAERGWEKLSEFSANRLLGEHVPYAVEAYPEGGMRHLSGESGLYCRVITDGLLGISFDEDGYRLAPALPHGLSEVSVKRIYLDGKLTDLTVGNDRVN